MTHSNTNFSREGQTYQSPSVEVLDLQVEGILCESGDPADWQPGEDGWFENN